MLFTLCWCRIRELARLQATQSQEDHALSKSVATELEPSRFSHVHFHRISQTVEHDRTAYAEMRLSADISGCRLLNAAATVDVHNNSTPMPTRLAAGPMAS